MEPEEKERKKAMKLSHLSKTLVEMCKLCMKLHKN